MNTSLHAAFPLTDRILRNTHWQRASASRFSFSSISRAWRCAPGWPACCCGGREAYEPLRPSNLSAAPSAGPSHLYPHKTNTAALKLQTGKIKRETGGSDINQRFSVVRTWLRHFFTSLLTQLSEYYWHPIIMWEYQMWVTGCKCLIDSGLILRSSEWWGRRQRITLFASDSHGFGAARTFLAPKNMQTMERFLKNALKDTRRINKISLCTTALFWGQCRHLQPVFPADFVIF